MFEKAEKSSHGTVVNSSQCPGNSLARLLQVPSGSRVAADAIAVPAR